MYKVSCNSCLAVSINGTPCHETGCSNGVFTFTKQGREYARYRVWSLDVWGNSKDSYEVNDRSNIGSVMIPIDCTDKNVIQALKKREWLGKRSHTKSFTIDGDDYMMSIDDARTSEPIYQLERE